MLGKEEKLEQFLSKLFDEKEPDYPDIRDDEEILRLAELSLLLKKEEALAKETFKEDLANDLKRELAINSSHLAERNRLKSVNVNFALDGVSLASVFSMLFRTIESVYMPLDVSKNTRNKQEDIKINYYKLYNKKEEMLLHNKRNNAILYWPFGQFAIF